MHNIPIDYHQSSKNRILAAPAVLNQTLFSEKTACIRVHQWVASEVIKKIYGAFRAAFED